MKPLRALVLAAIRVYQRHVSPHKGFVCAYRLHTGRASCSTLGWRAVRRWGVWRGLAVLRRRLLRCGVAHRRFVGTAPWRPHATQRGDCDVLACGLDCAHPGGCNGPSLQECAGCCDGCSCDWPDRRTRQADSAAEAQVHIPPYRPGARGPGHGRP